MNVFLDTEFTDLLEPYLISLGMVTERSKIDPAQIRLGTPGPFTEEFYIEVPYPDKQCTPFVREAVLPLLGREPLAVCQKDEVRMRILDWLALVRRDNEDIVICVDYETDWELFCAAMDRCIPPWIQRKHVWSDINELLFNEFFEKSGLPQHHALYDARANKYAYRPHMPITDNPA